MGDLPAGCVTLVWKVGEATQQVKQLAQRSGAAQSGNRIPAQVWLPGCRFFFLPYSGTQQIFLQCILLPGMVFYYLSTWSP